MTSKEDVLVIERTQEFFEVAEALGSFINSLNLSPKENNELVRLVCEQTVIAEKSGFTYGFKLGVKCQECNSGTYEVSGFLS